MFQSLVVKCNNFNNFLKKYQLFSGIVKLHLSGLDAIPVSYTHLDVYKRQSFVWSGVCYLGGSVQAGNLDAPEEGAYYLIEIPETFKI